MESNQYPKYFISVPTFSDFCQQYTGRVWLTKINIFVPTTDGPRIFHGWVVLCAYDGEGNPLIMAWHAGQALQMFADERRQIGFRVQAMYDTIQQYFIDHGQDLHKGMFRVNHKDKLDHAQVDLPEPYDEIYKKAVEAARELYISIKTKQQPAIEKDSTAG